MCRILTFGEETLGPSNSPLLPEDRLDQDPGPIPLELKEEGVGVLYQVVRSRLDEKPISHP